MESLCVGRCPGCLRMSKLCKNGACEACQRFGRNFGSLARRIREDDGFRRKCYEMLQTDVSRDEFVAIFGDGTTPSPEPSPEPREGVVISLFQRGSGTTG